MSPASKVRKKKRNVRRSSSEWIDHEPEAVRERPSWFAESIAAVLGNTAVLSQATGPRELEQATCELLGEQMHRAVHEVGHNLWFNWWFEELTVAAADRVRDADDLAGDWLLLHGLAAIGSPALRSFARHQVNALLKAARRRPAFARLPRWLASSHLVKATGEVWRMQDAYGTRLAVLAGMSYPHGANPSVFLFDIDACGFTTMTHAGAYDDLAQAAAAWRTLVGATADGTEPVEVRTGEQLSCLAHCDVGGDMINGDETRDLLDNWFRANRCIHDLAHALRKSPRLWPDPESLYHDLDTEPMATEFSSWYAERHGTAPEQDTVEALADEWLEGTLPETRYSISPHRVEFHTELIDGDWIPDHPATAAVKAMFADWARWLAERSGLPAELAGQVTDQAALQAPEIQGGSGGI
jgi:hypothetical protein